MAESIVLHFSSANWKELNEALSELATSSQTRGAKLWRYPSDAENDVTAYEYDDILGEYEDGDRQRLIERLGSPPSASLCIELRGSKGKAAVESAAALAIELLKRFNGVVDDLWSEPHLWNLSEIEQRVEKDGKSFLGHYRDRLRS